MDLTAIIEAIQGASRAAKDDALLFASLLPGTCSVPAAWGNEDEVALEWIEPGRHAIASFEGDGKVGYAFLEGSSFVPGRDECAPASRIPSDLLGYLEKT